MVVQPDYAQFLAQNLPTQTALMASYDWAGQRVWLKKAGPRHGMWRYRLLNAMATLTRLPMLRAVPNRGGTQAITIELTRLRQLQAAGIRVPPVLAAQPGGFLLGHLGAEGAAPANLQAEIEYAAQEADATHALALWRQGLDFIADVHARGQVLSQAFARNMVRCADGALAAIDFEDDPAASLSPEHCQLRDYLSYIHSTAIYLQQADAIAARHAWRQWLAAAPMAATVREQLQGLAYQLAWLRHLPTGRRWGRDVQRLRAAYDLLQR